MQRQENLSYSAVVGYKRPRVLRAMQAGLVHRPLKPFRDYTDVQSPVVLDISDRFLVDGLGRIAQGGVRGFRAKDDYVPGVPEVIEVPPPPVEESKRADSPFPDVNSKWKEYTSSPLCLRACTSKVACARCNCLVAQTRDSQCYVKVQDRWWSVHFQRGACVRDLLDAFPGFYLSPRRGWPAYDPLTQERIQGEPIHVVEDQRIRELVPHQQLAWHCEYELIPRGLGGAKGASKPKVKKMKKAVKAVKTVGKMVKAMKAKGKVRGKGDFFSDVFKKGRQLLGQGLTSGANFLHKKALDLIGKVSGSGDYKVNSVPIHENSLYTPSFTVPQFSNSADHGTIVCGHEPVGVILSSTGFVRTSFTVNPGLTHFPWLSRISPAWQRWKLRGCIVTWVPRVTQLSANGAGSVVLSARYDLTTATPQSIQEAEIAFGAIPGMPYERMAMAIECKNTMNPTNVLNIRFGSLPSGANAQFFDHCIIDVCTFGQSTSNVEIGELFVTYEIEYMMPTAEHIANSSTLTYAGYNNVSIASPYGTGSWAAREDSTLQASVVSTGSTLTVDLDDVTPLPVGSTWMAAFSTACTGGNVTTNSAISYGAGLANYTPTFKDSSGSDLATFATGVSSTAEARISCFQVVSGTAQQIVFSGLVLGAGVSSAYGSLIIVPILSTLADSERMMRRRYPKLFEVQDALTEMRALRSQMPQFIDQAEAKYHAFRKYIPGGPSVPDESDSESSDDDALCPSKSRDFTVHVTPDGKLLVHQDGQTFDLKDGTDLVRFVDQVENTLEDDDDDSTVKVDPLPVSKPVGVHIDLSRSQLQSLLSGPLPEPLLPRK